MSASDRDVATIAEGLGFTEGPVIRSRTKSVVVTSISRGCLYEITEAGAERLASAEAGVNGATEGAGDVFYMTHFWGTWPAPAGIRSTGGVLVWAAEPGLTWLTRDPVSPNDLCFGPDGKLYVTDPTRPHREDGRLWRCDVDSGDALLLCSLDWYPNGIGFGLEDDAIYVAATMRQQIVRLQIEGDNLTNPEVVVQMSRGVPDGFAFDTDGNVIIAAPSLEQGVPGTIQTWSTSGELLDLFEPGPSRLYSNVALSEDRTLYITDSDGERVLQVSNWPAAGLPLHPFRTQ